MSNGNGVTIELSPFWTTVISIVLTSLSLSAIYYGITLRDAVLANTRQDAILIAEQQEADTERQELEDRMTTIETRMAVLNDRYDNRHDSALWMPDGPARAYVTRLILRDVFGSDPRLPQPRPDYMDRKVVLPKHRQIEVMRGSA